MTFSLRPLGPQDGPAYAAVLAASPDTGGIGSAVRFEIDPYQALISLHRDTVGVVAESAGFDGFVGSGLIRFGQYQWEGVVRGVAILNTLVVRPDYRRRGLGSQLAKWRMTFARQRMGEGGVVCAMIQGNNTGSIRTARKWASQFLADRMAIVPLRMRAIPPRQSRHFHVRPALQDDLDAIADHLNRYYKDYNLYSPETKASLAAWLEETPFDSPFRHYRLITDKAGTLLAGMGLSENCRLRTTLITHLPLLLRLGNRVFNVIPNNGELREIALSRIWYAPGQLKAAQHLLGTMRWEWRARGTSLVLYADVHSRLMRLLGGPERFGRELVAIAVRASVPCSQGRLWYWA